MPFDSVDIKDVLQPEISAISAVHHTDLEENSDDINMGVHRV